MPELRQILRQASHADRQGLGSNTACHQNKGADAGQVVGGEQQVQSSLPEASSKSPSPVKDSLGKSSTSSFIADQMSLGTLADAALAEIRQNFVVPSLDPVFLKSGLWHFRKNIQNHDFPRHTLFRRSNIVYQTH